MDNRVTEFPGMYDEDLKKELYLLAEEEITEAQYNAIKEGYGVTGPDFQVVKADDGKFYLKGDMGIDAVKAVVDALIVEKGGEAVFGDGSESDSGSESNSETTGGE